MTPGETVAEVQALVDDYARGQAKPTPMLLSNDGDGEVSANVLAAMRSYGVTSVRWSERGNVLEKLAA